MRCPHCNVERTADNQRVVDSRGHNEDCVIRFRKCLACGKRWKTWEVAIEPWEASKERENLRGFIRSMLDRLECNGHSRKEVEHPGTNSENQ